MKLNQRIRELRKFLRKSQKEFADDLKITQANVSQLENGSSSPSAGLLERIKKVYPDINFNWLLSGEGNIFNKMTTKNEEASSYDTPVDFSEVIGIMQQTIQDLREDKEFLKGIIAKKMDGIHK